ncbi:MAG: FkbM family methyltransferase [Phycisphaerae bacterium]|nr:FkbM family methyltransferase [Phycisphaerae bacterium]
MLRRIKGYIKKFFLLCGLDIRRARPDRTYEWLREMNIRTVLDIGANKGQFVWQISKLLPDARYYSFEPLKDCYEQLLKRMRHFSNFRAFPFALGDKSGKTQIHHNDFSPSSSLLSMEELHKEAFPYTKNVRIEEIEIRRLDEIIQELDIEDNLLIKIDVQGFEDKVILGGEKLISRASILIIETSFQPLYKGQALFGTIYDALSQLGFRYIGAEAPIRNPKDGSILSCDSIFCRAGDWWAKVSKDT